MQINPIGIQSYQQAIKRDDAAATEAGKNQQTQQTPADITIEPQDESSGSSLAVRATGGTYADALTDVEKRALDLLFSRFKDGARFGPGYSADMNSDAEPKSVGGIVDVKG